jgi:diguanylate cyclase (GGDEF)-like protein
MSGPLPSLHACGCLSVTADGVISECNDVLAEWVGDARESIVGQHYSDILDLRLPTAEGALTPGDAMIRTRTGTPHPVVLGSVTEEADGTIQVAAFDVSPGSGFERPFAVATAGTDRGNRRLQILFNASVGFAEARSDEDAAVVLADVARRAFAATAVSVHLAHDGEVTFVAGVNPLEPHWPEGYPSTGTRTSDAHEVIIVPTPDDAEAYLPGTGMPDVYRAAGIHSVLAAPIRSKGVTLGSYLCYFDHPRTFDEEAVPLAEALANQTAQAIQRARLEETLRRMAMLDDLTGLPNRRLLEEQLAEIRQPAQGLLAVMFIDLDGFKAVNDTLGHVAGDDLLAQVAQRLRNVVREGELVGRFGGDEFVAVAWVPDAGAALGIAERLRSSFDEPFAGLPEHLEVTASIGVAIAPASEHLVLDQVVRTADQTMYASKAAGGNTVSIAPVTGPAGEPPVVSEDLAAR